MTQEESFRVLRSAFSILNDNQIENFRFHLRAETPVLCAGEAIKYTDGRGAG